MIPLRSLIFSSVALVSALAARAQTLPPSGAFTVAGEGFTVQGLEDGRPAFANRAYTWAEVPAAVRGWQYTRKHGGQSASITVTVVRGGTLYAATAGENGAIPGWQRVPDVGFHYTDAHATPMAVYGKPCVPGEEVVIPQRGWTGTLVLAPVLSAVARPVPGVIVAYSPADSRAYIGSPSLVILPNGHYVASHDLFGPGSTRDRTRVFGSGDRGETWQPLADLTGQWWSTLFVHRDALYLLGVSHEYGDAVIRRSADGGQTWTTPSDATHGLLAADRRYHCAPVPVVVSHGRLWRAMEMMAPGVKGRHFLALAFSAPVEADLLRADQWTASAPVDFPAPWPGDNWLEGNIVDTPAGLVDLLRTGSPGGDKAALVHLSGPASVGTFDPAADLFDFPGGGTKFTIRYDPVTRRYWSLVNKQKDPVARRNLLALVSSADLRHWTVHSVVLHDPDPRQVAFQYVDWQFDGDDLIFLSRTAFNGAHSFHDANYLTFHRIPQFRSRRD